MQGCIVITIINDYFSETHSKWMHEYNKGVKNMIDQLDSFLLMLRLRRMTLRKRGLKNQVRGRVRRY